VATRYARLSDPVIDEAMAALGGPWSEAAASDREDLR